MSKAITEKPPEDAPAPRPWTSSVEFAPSVVREDEPTVARVLGLFGAVLVIFAGVALLISAFRAGPSRLTSGWMTFTLVAGLLCMMYHAVFDRDLQVRRLYWGIGLIGVIGGAIVCMIPLNGVAGGMFIVGYPAMGLGLLFLLAFLKHEDDRKFRDLSLKALLGFGTALAVVGLLGGNVASSVGAPAGVTFLLPYGALLALLGLVFLGAFVSNEGTASDLGYRVGQGIGLAGALTILVAAGRAMPALIYKLGWMRDRPESYLVPGGLVLMMVGLMYVLVALALVSESKMVILARREVSAFFFSPIAHIVLLGQTLMGWLLFWIFVTSLTDPRLSLPEPVVQHYFVDYPPIICVLFIIPVLTMRLFSEEQRSGTMEVLLTAPVEEGTIVMAKFWASLAMFLFVWLPWALLLVGLRVVGGKEFDYHALFVFLLTLTVTGAGFVAMGLFFSSLSKNQIASAVLTFAGMLALTMVFFIARRLQVSSPKSIWVDVLMHISYVQMWIDSFRGFWVPRKVLFWVSFAIFWLFVTVKVLESRKWR